MKSIRNTMTLAGLSLVILALSATGAKAQNLTFSSFDGNFTLPVAAQWGGMTLPAGEYTLSYGQLFKGGNHGVVITGKADGNIRGMAIVKRNDDPATKKDTLVCVREGDTLVVRALEMPEIGTAAIFALPHGAKLVGQNVKHNGNTNNQLAEAHMLIQRIPVRLNAK